jgi:hypothetical protein
MGVKRRYRLVSPGTWQDGLEFVVPLAIGFFSHFAATHWVLPILVFPCVALHLMQLLLFLTIPEPKIECTAMIMLVDLMALGAQFMVNAGYVGPDFKVDSVQDDSVRLAWVKLGLVAGLVLIDLVRIWQFFDMDDEVEEVDDGPQRRKVVALVQPSHSRASAWRSS